VCRLRHARASAGSLLHLLRQPRGRRLQGLQVLREVAGLCLGTSALLVAA